MHNTVEVEAEATSIPQFLELNMDGLMAGQSRYASDVILPAGVTLISDPQMPVIHLSERSTAVEEVPVAAAAEGAPAEGAAPAADAAKE
jgi:large subunit ribosomal protein L25